MKLIPVIDIMGGYAVWGRLGKRDDYVPLVSPLCSDSDPVALAGRLQAQFGADTLYIADLDAIIGRGENRHLIQAIARTHPAIELWIDAGVGDPARLARFLSDLSGRPVIGSETLTDPLLPALAPTAVLSLDYRGRQLLGPGTLLRQLVPVLRAKPRDLILMSLHRVGSDLGPDLDLLTRLTPQVPGCRLFVAGGVRDANDLRHLESSGAAGVLVASALHDGRIGAADLTLYASHR